MRHEDAVMLLPEHLAGRLEAGPGTEVAAHLPDCDECLDLSRTYRLLAEHLRSSSEESSLHPSSAGLVACVLGGGIAPEGRHAEVRHHLDGCPSCGALAEAIQEAEEELGRRTRRVGRGVYFHARGGRLPRLHVGIAFAAAVALVLLAYPAYLGVVRLPRESARLAAIAGEKIEAETATETLRTELERTRTGLEAATSWSGPVPLPFLSGTLRGEPGPEARIPVAVGQPFVLLAIEPAIPVGGDPGERFRLEVLHRDGTTAWSNEMTALEIHRLSEGSGALVVVIPAERLPEDHYSLRLEGEGTSRRGKLFEAEFEVFRPR